MSSPKSVGLNKSQEHLILMITESYIKKHVLAKPQTLSIRSPKGLEELTLEEVKNCLDFWINREETLPADAAKIGKATAELVENAISVKDIPYRTAQNLTLRLGMARDVLLIVRDVRCGSVKELNEHFTKMDWPLYVQNKSTISVRIDSYRSRIFHEGLIKESLAEALALHKVKIVDREQSSQFLEVKLNGNRLQISLSLAGQPLYKRGYKSSLKSVASIKEDLAYGAITYSLNWLRKKNPGFIPETIYNPFAGSGTLAFEYLNKSLKIAPGFFERSYGLELLPIFQDKSFEHERRLIAKEVESAVVFLPKVICVEKNKEQCQALEENASHFFAAIGRAELKQSFQVVEEDFFSHRTGASENIFLLANPPYGRRLEGSDAPELFFKKIFTRINNLKIQSGLIFIPEGVNITRCKELIPGYQSQYRKISHGGLEVSIFVFAIEGI
jgi:23S rRNA G2445 N2-methylase RlmL